MENLAVIILAAGQGTRMKSKLPKVLHQIAGKPLLSHVLGAARQVGNKPLVVVVGHGAERVQQACAAADISWAMQERQLGTGHAVRCAEVAFGNHRGDVLILSGDVPLIKPETLTALVTQHRASKAALTLLTAKLNNPRGYGRIVRDPAGMLTGVIEEKDASATEKELREVNAGIYVVSAQFLFGALAEVRNHNQQGEYYLPDIVPIAIRQNRIVKTMTLSDAREMLGINTREELAAMEQYLREAINRKWMLAGVTLIDPATTYIDEAVTIGQDTVIGPNTHLKGKTVIGKRCQIDGSAYLTDMEIADEVQIKFCVMMTASRIDSGAIVGPFAQLRPGTHLGRNVHIGNFVEAKAAIIGEGTKASHLTYLGDVTIGRDTNIGAGTITCNYDGFQKYKSKIGDRVQIGSDTTLIAPIELGDDVYVATASTLRHDVPAGALAFNERKEATRAGWTEQKRRKMQGAKK